MYTCSKCGGEVPYRCNCTCERQGKKDDYTWTIVRHGPTVFQWTLNKRNEQIDVGHASSLVWADEQIQCRIGRLNRLEELKFNLAPGETMTVTAPEDEEAQWFYRVQPYQWDAAGRKGITFQVMKQRAICTARQESDADEIAKALNDGRRNLKQIDALKDQVDGLKCRLKSVRG